MSWILTTPKDFSLIRIIEQSTGLLLPPFTVSRAGTQLERVEELKSKRVLLLTILQAQAGLQIQTSQQLNSTEAEEISHKVWRMLRLGENLTPFFKLRAADQRLKRQQLLHGGRLLRGTTLIEDVLKALLLTQPTAPHADHNRQNVQLISWLVDQLGSPLPSNPTRHAFPTCEKLQSASDILTELLGTDLGQTVRELITCCKTQLPKITRLQRINYPLDLLIQELNQLPGMQPEMLALLMLSLGRYDYLPPDNETYHYLQPERAVIEAPGPSPDFSEWHPWEGLAYWLGEKPSSSRPLEDKRNQ